jgi:hypothetical protein
VSLGQVDEPDRYRDRRRLASSEGEPGLEATYRNETQPSAWRAPEGHHLGVANF